MRIIVKPHDIEIEKTEKVNENEYNITKCEFEFSEEYTEDLVKVALFTNSVGTYKQIIFNNECDIPPEILKVQEASILGVYAYKEENEELVLRYSPEPIKFYISKGSYKENAENSEPITPTDKEQIEQAIANLEADKQDKLTAGDNITIEDNVINAVDTIYDDSEIRADIQGLENSKVDKVAGKGLSTNDYTNEEKSKLASLENYDDTEVKSDIANLQTNKADKSEIPDVSNFVTKDVNNLTYYTTTSNMNTAISNAVGTETSNRQSADNNLQSQIDAITSSSDVVDVVSTYTDLQNYDITKLTDKDVLKVMQDSTHNNAISYYRWTVSGSIGSWIYVGSEGPFYTKGEIDTFLADKLEESDLTDYVKNTDYATSSAAGVIKTGYGSELNENGILKSIVYPYSEYASMPTSRFISKGTLENVIEGKELVNQTTLDNSQTVQNEQINYLDNVVEQLPKVSANGTDISLNDTIEAKMSVEIEGNTEQTQYTGKNLFNKNAEGRSSVTTKTVLDTGVRITITDGGNSRYYAMPLGMSELLGNKVTISSDIVVSGSNTAQAYLFFGASTSTAIQYIGGITGTSSGSKKATVTIPSSFPTNCDRIWLLLYASAGEGTTGDYVNYNNLQAEIGTTQTSYEPYVGGKASPSPDYPQNIKVVTGDNEVEIIGKNLLKIDKTSQTVNGVTFTINEDKSITANGTATALCTFNLIDSSFILPIGQYYISGCPSDGSDSTYRLDINNGAVTNQRDYGNGNTFTLSEDTTVGNVRLRIANGTTVNNLVFKPMIFKGSTATDYEPYQSQKYPLNLGNLEFCGMGDYRDYIYHDKVADKWYKYSSIGKVVLGGGNNETWYLKTEPVSENTTYFSSTIIDGLWKENMNVLCSHFTLYENLWNNDVEGIQLSSNSQNLRVRISKTLATDVSSFKTWLSTHNTIVYYVLDTPTTTEITDTTLISQLNAIEEAMSYAGQTNITSTYETGNAPLFINAEAFSDIEKELDNKIDDVQINGTSIVENGVANIPIATNSTAGVAKGYPNLGTTVYQGAMIIEGATDGAIKNPSSYSSWKRPILPTNQHASVFYGLAKASGDTTQASSSNEVGTYTDTAITKIREMFKIKTLTQAEYDLILQPDANTIYIIVEETV